MESQAAAIFCIFENSFPLCSSEFGVFPLSRGRKPKPTHLRVIEGNPGRRPLNNREPKPVGDLHRAPEWFSPDQHAMWAHAIANAPAGLLKHLDRDMMVAWCVACDLHRQATVAQGKLNAAAGGSSLLSRTPDGNFVQSPYLPIINRQATIMKAIAAELGFTPSSRTRIAIDEGESKNDPASKYIG
jgi:P27 family predicted phage terminase small subunit